MNWNSPIHLLSLRQNNLIPKIMRKFKKIDENTWIETTEDIDGTIILFLVAIIAIVVLVGHWAYPKILSAINWCSQTFDSIAAWFDSIF